MRAQFINTQAVGIIGVFSLDGHDPCSPKLGRFFHDKRGTFFADWREQQPDIGGHLQGLGLGLTQKNTPLFTRLDDFSVPFAIRPVNNRHNCARREPHDSEQIMRLIPR